MPPPAAPLKYLFPGWYAAAVGLAGLSLAWQGAVPLMGDAAAAMAGATAVLAAAVFTLLAAATVWRGWHHPEAWADDCRHPVRHTFVALLPVAMLLLATVAVGQFGPHPLVHALWWAGASGQLFATWWVVARWWRPAAAGGLAWASVTPALIMPAVGNVLAPLAGVPLGHVAWSVAQLGVGLLFWPVVMVLLMVRLAVQGPWPDRLRPTVFILVAPPAVVGLSLLQLGAPTTVAWALWGMAAFIFLWVGAQARQIIALPFSTAHWALSFPLAVLAALTLRLAGTAGPMATLAPVLLALVTVVVAWLALATWRGLRDGTLLAPETVAAIAPAG